MPEGMKTTYIRKEATDRRTENDWQEEGRQVRKIRKTTDSKIYRRNKEGQQEKRRQPTGGRKNILGRKKKTEHKREDK